MLLFHSLGGQLCVCTRVHVCVGVGVCAHEHAYIIKCVFTIWQVQVYKLNEALKVHRSIACFLVLEAHEQWATRIITSATACIQHRVSDKFLL